MSILNFKEKDCKACYKCLRSCMVKAISFNNNNAQVIADKCILCGRCIAVCPQNAKVVRNDATAVKKLISDGKKVVATVAPAYVSSFPDVSRAKFFSAVKALGFTDVIDTAVGAKYVSEQYNLMLESGDYPILISSACPAVVRLVQYNYHKALPYLAPVVSPMVASSRMIKKQYGEETSVVFIGPCIAKKREAEECGSIDAALTFEELEVMFSESGIVVQNAESDPNLAEFKDKAHYYPISRGIIKSMYGYRGEYDYVYVDGVERVSEVLANIEYLDKMFIEMSACENSCVNGPCIIKQNGGFIKANECVRRFAKANEAPSREIERTDDVTTKFRAKTDGKYVPLEQEIEAVLAGIGKANNHNILNCGACGYNTCREKAIAVIHGEANLEMCLPYMRDRAEKISSEVFKNSPNCVMSVDADLNIIDVNEEGRRLFGINDSEVKGRAIMEYMNPGDFVLAINNIKKIANKRTFIEKTERWAEISIFNVPQHKFILFTARDVTKAVQYEESIKKVKFETVETTSKVIEKQMQIVQEIASLLGETTADTKVALTKLKNAIVKEYDDNNE